MLHKRCRIVDRLLSITTDDGEDVMGWVVEDCAERPKTPGGGEDRVVVDGEDVSLAAVIDGATDKSGRLYGDRRGGAIAAEAVAQTLRKLPTDATARGAVDTITDVLAAQRTQWGIAPDDLLAPSAVAAVFNAHRREIWRVGDVHIALRTPQGWHRHPGTKKIDEINAQYRAAVNVCHRLQGVSDEDLADADPGRVAIMPVLKAQNALAHTDHELGFGLLDGRTVLDRHVEVFSVAGDVREIVIASDGYLSPAPSLEAAEKELCESLRVDPLRIGEHKATKGVAAGASRFDDCTYLRVCAINLVATTRIAM